MKGYFFLISAILFEIIGTSLLKLSNGFSSLIPSIGVIVSFGLSFLLLVVALKTIPLSFAYSIWAGLGTAGAGLIGILFFNEMLSKINIIGLFIIILGVVIMNINTAPENQRHS